MDKRVKFSLKTKLSAVRSIISGHDSCLSAARKIGCSLIMVQRWVALYQQQGVKGLNLRNGNYSGHFKIQVVRYMLKNKLSLVQTAAFFGIPGTWVVFRWRKIYEHLGVSGLLKQTRGRKKSLMPSKKKTAKKGTATNSPAEKLAALQKEVEYLRAENAFLKKLDALIQQEKVAKAQSKRQKPSRN